MSQIIVDLKDAGNDFRGRTIRVTLILLLLELHLAGFGVRILHICKHVGDNRERIVLLLRFSLFELRLQGFKELTSFVTIFTLATTVVKVS